MSEASASPFPSAKIDPGDDFVFIYTSGTTGLPKPCRVSHARSVLIGAAFGHIVFEFRESDTLYSVLPLYHASALLLGAGSAIVCGVPMAMRESFSASAFWDDVHRYDATAILYIGELCRYLLNSPSTPNEKNHKIRVATGNGLRPDVWNRFQQRLGIGKIREFYGATEAPGFILNVSGKEGSVGRMPLGGFGWLKLVRFDADAEKHVLDEHGWFQTCDVNETGELLIRLPPVSAKGLEFRGYTDKEATEAKILRNVFKEGDAYFRSGDLLRRDEEGFYYFVNRIGDTYRFKGENISTAEVADVIGSRSSFAEVTIVGIQLPGVDGQMGLAAIVPSGDFDSAELENAVQELPHYAWPRFIRVLPKIAKTGTFKVQKTQLKREGADPSVLKDPLYYLNGRKYETLTDYKWNALNRTANPREQTEY